MSSSHVRLLLSTSTHPWNDWPKWLAIPTAFQKFHICRDLTQDLRLLHAPRFPISSITTGYPMRSWFRTVAVPWYHFAFLSQILTKPEHSYAKAFPWSNDPGPKNEHDDMTKVFSRQVERWWEFRKWQMDNWGSAIEDDGFSAYFATQTRRHLLLGLQNLISDS